MKKKLGSFLKKTFIVLLMLLITFSGYVYVVTANTKNMTIRQRVLKAVYPAFTLVGKGNR
jgi:type IV secretory pathway component VirB8